MTTFPFVVAPLGAGPVAAKAARPDGVRNWPRPPAPAPRMTQRYDLIPTFSTPTASSANEDGYVRTNPTAAIETSPTRRGARGDQRINNAELLQVHSLPCR